MNRSERPTWRRAGYGLAIASALVALGAGAADATPPSKGIYGGVITVGRGVAGVTLGMTRGQVFARLGRPLTELPNADMSYEALPPKSPHGLFDIYLEASRVRMFVISPNNGWRLADGIRIFARGAVGRLMNRFGRRLRPTRIEDGERAYRITERYRGRTVWTEFYVARFGRGASVYGFDLLFPRGR